MVAATHRLNLDGELLNGKIQIAHYIYDVLHKVSVGASFDVSQTLNESIQVTLDSRYIVGEVIN